MSIAILAQIWENGPDSKSELLVLMALADFANGEGHCWPSLASIGKKARLKRRQLIILLQKLETDGWFTVRHRHDPSGRQTSSSYQLNLVKVGGAKNAPSPEGGAKTAPRGVQKMHPREGAKNAPLEPTRKNKRAREGAAPGTWQHRNQPIADAKAATRLCAEQICCRLSRWQISQLKQDQAVLLDGQMLGRTREERKELLLALRETHQQA